MNGLVRELSRELARAAIQYHHQSGQELCQRSRPSLCDADHSSEVEGLADELFARATAWLDGQDVQGLMLKVLAKRW
jgi:hypothetical protein